MSKQRKSHNKTYVCLPSGVVPGAVVVSEATVGGEAAPVPGVGRGQGGGQEAEQQTASEAGAGLQQRPGTILDM